MEGRRLAAGLGATSALLALVVLAFLRPVAEANGYLLILTPAFVLASGFVLACTLGAFIAVLWRPRLPFLRAAVLVLSLSLARGWAAAFEWPSGAPKAIVLLHGVEVAALALAASALVAGLVGFVQARQPTPS